MTASGSDEKKAKTKKKKATSGEKRGVAQTEAEEKSIEADEPEEDEDDAAEDAAEEGVAAKKSHEVDESLEPFLEGDHETRMTFDSGGFPMYVKAVWAVFLVSVTYYMYVYALPDLTAWGSP